MTTKNDTFQPVDTFTWAINRAERSLQARWLVPLLNLPEGRRWLLAELNCPCSPEEAQRAEVFHLCFPLRDIFTADYYACRGRPDLEREFITYYNALFDLPPDFGVEELWLTAPDGELRHPGAGGRAGWYDEFLRARITDDALYQKARDVRRMLGTEADVLLLTSGHVVLVECKYLSSPSIEQYERHQMMGTTLARRLDRQFHFGLVVEQARDPHFARLKERFVLWDQVADSLEEFGGA